MRRGKRQRALGDPDLLQVDLPVGSAKRELGVARLREPVELFAVGRGAHAHVRLREHARLVAEQGLLLERKARHWRADLVQKVEVIAVAALGQVRLEEQARAAVLQGKQYLNRPPRGAAARMRFLAGRRAGAA